MNDRRTACLHAYILAVLACAAVAPQDGSTQTLPPAGTAPPVWHTADICKRDSVAGQCDLFETRAAKTVSGSWAFIPDDIRKFCLAEAAKPEDQSWRLLSSCIEGAMGRNIDRKAVQTLRTPAEPVPPPKLVAVPAIAIPPPATPAASTDAPPASAPKQ